ncbi:hypothetical protein M6D93_12305 [Jatrophihabitans telluris]|uniref:Uncharacterized protein n=1 Tax=Jatrophihabitans telluris TaxID=2038343 RepID=A0ABY4QVS3_9ACTN|nr:hypothetical protein [Jatrophihabitans telluris]UQX87084.1 hypothetical protein M6D93_12305 [Jatrophihabitans telluris]
MQTHDIRTYLPADFEQRLARAWAWTVWRDLSAGSGPDAFGADDPIRLLAHDLDLWVPAITEVMQQTLRSFPLVVGDGELPTEIRFSEGSIFDGAVPGWPRMGGDLSRGEEEATDIVAATLEQADRTGRLRGILDAVRSNRMEDEFSERWSHARNDFERKLYRKRSKIAVKFVELSDTIPVQGPGTEIEVENRLVFADFMAL